MPQQTVDLLHRFLRQNQGQLSQRARENEFAALRPDESDPLLLLGPSLLLIAVALIFLRIFPHLLRLASWWANRVRGLILPFGLAKLSRDPVGPSRVVLLISLAAGLTLFASLFDHSLAVRQSQIAHYNTGADVRVRLPIDAGSAEFETVAHFAGVQSASPVYYNGRSRLSTNLGQQVEMLAVDPATLPQVSRYAPFISGVTLADVMPAVQGIGADGAIPAVFSADAPPSNKEIGDHIQYVVGTHRVTFEVRGIIANFPLLSDRFFITNLAAVEQAVNLTTLSEPWVGQREVWLAVEPGQTEAVVDQIANGGPFGSRVLADTASTEALLRSNLVAQETLGAFELNAITLVALSVVVFLLVHFFAARQRLYEFSLLRATGMATRQLLGLLTLEGVIMMALGLLAGSGIGAGLALIMRPFLSRVLSAAVGGDAIQQILVNWSEVFSLYGLLVGFYGVALLLLLFFLMRAGIHRALRIGEE
jgi:putative ABC transport system permease protein